MSAVIAHVLFVRIKSLSVKIMLLEYSFGKLKYDSTTLPMSSFSGFSPISASRSSVSLTILIFFYEYFSVWVSPTPTPRTKIFNDVPVDGAGSKLSGGISSGLSVAVQPKRGSSVFMCFPADTSTCWMHSTPMNLVLTSPRRSHTGY